MFATVGSTNGRWVRSARVGHTEGVGETLAGVGHGDVVGGGHNIGDGANGAGVDHTLGHHGCAGAGAGDDEAIKVQTQLRVEIGTTSVSNIGTFAEGAAKLSNSPGRCCRCRGRQ